jgi:hypothetical protein
MFPKIKFRPTNIAWLSENCVASYFNYFVIGKLNQNIGFDKNKYLKFRFVDFQKFTTTSEEVNAFFFVDPLLSKEEVIIIETCSYKISWQGSFNVTDIKKEVKFKAEFKDEKTQKATSNFEIKFDNEEFSLLLRGFLNIAVDVFCYCTQVRCVIKCFLEKVAEKNIESENYLKNFKRDDYFKLCFEICHSLQITKFKSYFILDKLLMHKEDLLTLIKLKNVHDSQSFLTENGVGTFMETQNCLFIDNIEVNSSESSASEDSAVKETPAVENKN